VASVADFLMSLNFSEIPYALGIYTEPKSFFPFVVELYFLSLNSFGLSAFFLQWKAFNSFQGLSRALFGQVEEQLIYTNQVTL
jgi:hypothetical protein